MKEDDSNGLIAAGLTTTDHSSEDLRFRKLIENSHDGITLLDKNFNITYRSNSAERIVGWKTIDRIAKNVADVVHLDCLDCLMKCLEEIVRDPSKSQTCIFKSKHSDGHYIWLEGIFTNFLNDPDIAAVVCNFRDISEQKRNDEQFHKIMQELLAYKCALDESAIVAITDPKGTIQYVNDYFCRISQYGREELIGQDHRIVNSSYHDKKYIRNLWTTIARGKTWTGEFRNRAKDGTYYWVDTTIIPFLNDKGKPYQYLSIRWDITAQKKIISALQESEKRYSDLFQLSPLPTWIYSIESLRFLNVNEAAIRHYGYSLKEFMSMTILDIRPIEEISKTRKLITQAKKQPGYYRRISVHRKKDLEIINVDIHSNVINYKGEQAILVVINDVTERLQHIKAIEDRNKKLEEISWEQSHLVRAPLARIKGLVPLVTNPQENPSERELILRYLSASAEELDQVIMDIIVKSSEL
ncbi:MAG TPA: PAS domain-containing protein [Mucilaginibacter sp.]|nr:PAS domain-containing protein [Mucilaginibacter sp.]